MITVEVDGLSSAKSLVHRAMSGRAKRTKRPTSDGGCCSAICWLPLHSWRSRIMLMTTPRFGSCTKTIVLDRLRIAKAVEDLTAQERQITRRVLHQPLEFP